eukprot:CAMPEP_0201522506 /NCGR_PEP_ID=MMETSP0161_2-20130828/17803_1 /ASSEMBLY_ACC=CAM_ASM_000251 /TAXON_ID=180227 /ORGANISM="Neoparamoeba aestuarina, Strain SoJaBio B1-5/56/2" /LENGTH=124 /DNA_ID=CAMNT_0047921367 /DNA_START=85 /DNA_END=463 /DNA_ORIENTATION=+
MLILRDGFGAFTHRVLGKFTWKEETGRCLELASRKGLGLAELGDGESFHVDAVEHILGEGVHNLHSLGGDAEVWVDFFEDTVHVGAPRVDLLLVSSAPADRGDGSGLRDSLLVDFDFTTFHLSE